MDKKINSKIPSNQHINLVFIAKNYPLDSTWNLFYFKNMMVKTDSFTYKLMILYPD